MMTIYGIGTTSDGGFILAGLVGTDHNFNFALKKVSATGDVQWTRYVDHGTWDWAFSAEQTLDGGYIFAGYTDYGDIFCSDAYIVKTDSDGETEWDISMGNARNDMARCVRPLENGGYIACGYTRTDTGETPAQIWLLRFGAEATPVSEPGMNQPESFTLYQAYPNPFNAETTIRYSIPYSSPVEIVIYDVLGHPAAIILSGVQEAGAHGIVWKAQGRPSGTYFYRLKSNFGQKTGRVVLLK